MDSQPSAGYCGAWRTYPVLPKPRNAGKWSLRESPQTQSKAGAMAGKQTKAGAGCDRERHQRGRES